MKQLFCLLSLCFAFTASARLSSIVLFTMSISVREGIFAEWLDFGLPVANAPEWSSRGLQTSLHVSSSETHSGPMPLTTTSFVFSFHPTFFCLLFHSVLQRTEFKIYCAYIDKHVYNMYSKFT